MKKLSVFLCTAFAAVGFAAQATAAGINLYNAHEFDLDDGKNYGDQEDAVFMGYLGGGAEWRLTEGLGLFADYRYNFVDQSDSNYGQARLGMRFAW